MKKIILFIFLLALPVLVSADDLIAKLKGKILLQVEDNGEAWYVNPSDEMRYYMGRPEDAFELMKELGVGISNKNIERIPVADLNLSGLVDKDNDGLSLMIENSFNTSSNYIDTDNDGFTDKEEILSGYNPVGSGRFDIDNEFANSVSGIILLQVEQNGEAWYVNPDDKKRYFLGRPADAFNVMRELGLGILNSNLNLIVENKTNSITEDMLDACSKLTEKYKRNECFQELAYSKLDSDICLNMEKDDVSGWYSRDYCYINLMELTKNPYLCENVTGEGVGPSHDKYDCYKKAAIEFEDVDLCEKLENNDMFNDDWCYYTLAVKKNNKGICDLISDNDTEGYKEACLKIEE